MTLYETATMIIRDPMSNDTEAAHEMQQLSVMSSVA